MSRLLRVCFLVAAVLAVLVLPSALRAQIAAGVSIRVGPPALPVYAQPICPGPGYLWTPGYWAYGPYGYYWVPGTWVMAPAVGLLWTPGYWGWSSGFYAWHAGYWGPHVGFYGGINYGFGYGGVGFVGGEWRGGVLAYNTAVTNVNTTVIRNTYVNHTVVNKTVVNNNVSYNGGAGGTLAHPTVAERAAENEHHIAPTTMQAQHEHVASQNHELLASVNHGMPLVGATSRPGQLSEKGVTAAHPAALSANRPQSTANSGIRSNAAARSDRPPNAGQASHGSQNAYERPPNNAHADESRMNRPHPNNTAANNSHSNRAHPANEHANVHPNNPHPPGNQPHERPGR